MCHTSRLPYITAHRSSRKSPANRAMRDSWFLSKRAELREIKYLLEYCCLAGNSIMVDVPPGTSTLCLLWMSDLILTSRLLHYPINEGVFTEQQYHETVVAMGNWTPNRSTISTRNTGPQNDLQSNWSARGPNKNIRLLVTHCGIT
jgi:hypothetical protein